jgi:predicted RNA-binding protein
MCLSTVYALGENGARQILGEYISSLTVLDNTVTISDILGKEQKIPGVIQSIDLVKNAIVIGKAG